MPELTVAELTLRIGLAAGARRRDRARTRAARARGWAAHSSAGRARRRPVHDRLGVRLVRLQLLEPLRDRLRPDQDRGADRHRRRLPRRGRDHPPGADRPRPDDRGDAMGRGRDRHGRRRRLLRGGGDHDGHRDREPLAAPDPGVPRLHADPTAGATARDRASERCQRAARAGYGGGPGRGRRVLPARALARRPARHPARGAFRTARTRRCGGSPISRTSGRCVGARSAALLRQPAQAGRAAPFASRLEHRAARGVRLPARGRRRPTTRTRAARPSTGARSAIPPPG